MSRRDRRAALARGKALPTASLNELAAEATLAVQQGRALDAELLCKQMLAIDPRQPTALNIMGLLYQASGNHRLAAKTLAKAVAVNAKKASFLIGRPDRSSIRLRHWMIVESCSKNGSGPLPLRPSAIAVR